MSKVVAVTATRRTDAGRERVALNTAYVRALTAAGLVPLIVPPPRGTPSWERPIPCATPSSWR